MTCVSLQNFQLGHFTIPCLAGPSSNTSQGTAHARHFLRFCKSAFLQCLLASHAALEVSVLKLERNCCFCASAGPQDNTGTQKNALGTIIYCVLLIYLLERCCVLHRLCGLIELLLARTTYHLTWIVRVANKRVLFIDNRRTSVFFHATCLTF